MSKAPSKKVQPLSTLTSWKITAIYALIGALWVWLSDAGLSYFIHEPTAITELQTLKGCLYVLLTSILLYGLIQKSLSALQRSERELRQSHQDLAIAEATVRQQLQASRLHQAELEKSEQRYRRIYELASDYAYTAIVTTDRQILVEWVTEGFLHASGYSLAEMQPPQNWLAIVHPDDLESVEQKLPALLSGQLTVNHLRIVTKQGEVRWVESYAKPEWDEGEQRVVGILGTLKDVTQQKQVERALRESEARFRAVSEATPIPIIIGRATDGLIVYANQHLHTTFGYSAQEMLGRVSPDLYYDTHDRPILLARVAQDGFLRNYELRLKKADGTPFWGALSGCQLMFEGEMTTLAAFFDITEIKQAEEALRQSEQKYRELVNNLKEIVFQRDCQGIWTFLNPAWVEVMGHTVEATLGTVFLDYVHPSDRPYSWQRFEQLLRTQASCRYEVRYVAQNGDVRWLEMFAHPILNAAGEVIGVAGTLINVTERKTAELQLQALNLQLEGQVQERTAQLEARMQELQELSHLKDDFLNTVSHELRTPVSNMKMAIRMLQATLPTPTIAEEGAGEVMGEKYKRVDRYIQILDTECSREISLINDLLDLQRIESALEPLQLEPIPIEHWLTLSMDPFQERAHSRQQRLFVEVAAEIGFIWSHLPSLDRILAELLNNACKYTPPQNEISVKVSYSFANLPEGVEPQRFLRLTVGNSGVEIPQAELSRIFDKFYRLPSSDPWKQGGTGLGLALVQRLVDQLSGKIWAESDCNQTQFIVELPG